MGLIIQELDLEIRHCSGKNLNVDALSLSHNPVPTCSNVKNPYEVKGMNVGELALSELVNACESAALNEPANAYESAALPEP